MIPFLWVSHSCSQVLHISLGWDFGWVNFYLKTINLQGLVINDLLLLKAYSQNCELSALKPAAWLFSGRSTLP